MIKNILLVMFLLISVALYSQEKMYIHKSDNITLGALISKTDSIYFNPNGSVVYFNLGDTLAEFPKTAIDSILFGYNDTTVYVNYNGATVSVINPLAFEGVSVVVNGADVTVAQTGEIRDINYKLSGTTTDGMFKIYSEKRFNLLLNNVNITNVDGPAINIQSDNKVFVNLVDGSNNILTDGSVYAAPVIKNNGNAEDQDATFFSEGKLEFIGTGNLTINGKGTDKHGLCSDDVVEIDKGNLIVSSALKDGIHANDGFKIHGGSVNVKATGDAIDGGEGYVHITGGTVTTINTTADTKSIKCDSTLIISGGNVNLTVGGVMSKGIKAKQNITLSGGNITINTSGGVALTPSGSGYDASYCTAINSDSSIFISGATVSIISTGISGKGISANGNITITNGSVTITTAGAGSTYTNSSGVKDSYSSSCISTDGNLIILGGNVIVASSGTGGKGISVKGTAGFGDTYNSPTVKITTTGAKFLVSGTDYCHPKALKTTGVITINNGTIDISSSDDGIHSDASITQNNGNVTVSKSVEGIESKFITINGGSINITASNDGFNLTFSTQSGGTESNDGSCLYINGGTVMASCTNGDAIDSNGNIVISGGTVIANGPSSGAEEAVDFNGSFTMNGGLFIGAGSNSNMTKSMSTSSTQRNLFITSGNVISSSTLFHIQNASGTDIITFLPQYGCYKLLFSSPELSTGVNYSIYTGGSYTGGSSVKGLYSGGTYSSTGATLKKTTVLSTTSTVTTINF